MEIHEFANIALRPSEIVVSAVAYRDYILVVTDRGTIYKVYPEVGP